MEIRVLIENTPARGLMNEHGLSLYIRYRETGYLLDTGSSGAFLENAGLLGINLKEATACILSHGHYDHGGGLEAYLRNFPDARVYAMEGADGEYYSGSGGILHEISVPRQVWACRHRFVFLREQTRIGDGVYLIPHSTPGLEKVGERAGLYRKREGKLEPDDFSHELSLVFDTEAGLVIFNSCSHSGIRPILEEVKGALPGRKLLAFFGGLHMKGKRDGQEICAFSEEEVKETAEYLKKEELSWLYTGHCTGKIGYERLRSFLGEGVKKLETGGRYTIRP